jgi:hypothetical protein
MTRKDTTGDKLVASVRKTRKSTAGGTSAAKQTAQTSRAAKTRKPAARKKSTASTSKHKKQLIDMFQSGRRVWPD